VVWFDSGPAGLRSPRAEYPPEQLLFIEGLADEIIAYDKKLGKTTSKADAGKIAMERWREALKNAVGLNKAEFDSWAKNRSSKPGAATTEPDSDDSDNGDGMDAEAAEAAE
jgi:hypothetical protein